MVDVVDVDVLVVVVVGVVADDSSEDPRPSPPQALPL